MLGYSLGTEVWKGESLQNLVEKVGWANHNDLESGGSYVSNYVSFVI